MGSTVSVAQLVERIDVAYEVRGFEPRPTPIKMVNKIIKTFLLESNKIEDVWDKNSLKQAECAWNYIIKEKKLNPFNIKKTHKILMLNQPIHGYERGYFRKRPVWIGGKEAMSYLKIPKQIKTWCDNINYEPKCWKEYHVGFERIHPFIDGNGRIGRILMNWQRIKTGLDILIIKEEEKQKYYSWFN